MYVNNFVIGVATSLLICTALPCFADVIFVPPSTAKIALGTGLHAHGATNTTSIAIRQPYETKEHIGGIRITNEIEGCNTLEELEQKLQLDPSTALNVGFAKLSGKGDFIRNASLNNYCSYILVHENVDKGTTMIVDPKLTSAAESLLKAPDKFRETYGDGFVAGHLDGAEMYGLIEVVCNSTEQKHQMDAALRSIIGPYRTDSELVAAINSATADYEKHVKVIRLGGIPQPNSSSYADFVKALKSFPDEAETVEASKNVRALVIMPFSALGYPEELVTLRQDYFLQQLSEKMKHQEEELADIRFVLSHPDRFQRFDENKLREDEAARQKGIEEILISAHKGYESSKNCTDLALKTNLKPLNLPQIVEEDAVLVKANPLPNDLWQNTHIHLAKGQTVAIYWKYGQWNIDANHPEAYGYCGADGYPPVVGKTLSAHQKYPANGPVGALVGRVGTDIFLIGSNVTHLVTSEGDLELAINDDATAQPGLADNGGSLTVGIVPLQPPVLSTQSLH